MPTEPMKEKNSFFKYEGVNYLLPFILITACFALWGFANDVTNPMVKAFSKIFRMSVTQGTLTQVRWRSRPPSSSADSRTRAAS